MAARVPAESAARPRVGKAFTSAKAEKYVLASAVVTAMVYLVRKLTEGETSPAPATNKAAAFLGKGAAPSFGEWIVGYTVSYLALSLMAVAVPELAAAFAGLIIVGTLLESGGQFATDLSNLHKTPATPAATTPTTASAAAQNTFNRIEAGTAPTGGPLTPPGTPAKAAPNLLHVIPILDPIASAG